VQEAGDFLLARSALSHDEHGCLTRGHEGHLFEERPHRRALGDELAGRLGAVPQLPILRLQAPLVEFQAPSLERVAQGEKKPLRTRRFLQEIEGPPAGRLDGQPDLGAAGDHHDREAGTEVAERAQKIEPGAVRQIHIEQGRVGEGLACRPGEPLAHRLGGDHAEAACRQQRLEGETIARMVIDHENQRLLRPTHEDGPSASSLGGWGARGSLRSKATPSAVLR
jgi:hypothetical protein